MAVDVKVLGAPDAPDFANATALAEQWRTELRGAEGRISVIPNALLFGHRTREHDLIVIGHLTKPHTVRGVKCRWFDEPEEVEGHPIDVKVFTFVFHIEVKSHDPGSIRFVGASASVPYRDGTVDASAKSHLQKEALRKYLAVHAQSNPFVCNFLWFTSCENSDFPKVPHNFLGGVPTFKWTIWLACQQCFPRRDNYAENGGLLYAFKASGDDSAAMTRALRIFEEQPPTIGNLTRKKLEAINAEELASGAIHPEIGERMMYVEGRAGTGKTMRLLHWAHDAATAGCDVAVPMA